MAAGRSRGGRLVAERGSAAGLTFLHQDHLGSTSLQTSSSGAYLGQQVRGPFGQPWLGEGTLNPLSSPATDLQYTGQRSFEAAFGSLLHYGARWYSPGLGRFRSPDTVVPNPGNPWDLNRYSDERRG